MNLSSQAFSLLGMAVVGAGVVAEKVRRRASKEYQKAAEERRERLERHECCAVDLAGSQPISVDCLKKPVPIFTVYQY